MIELMMLVVIISLVALVGVMEVLNKRERKELINRIIAKSAEEVINMELADNTKIEVKKPEKPEDIVDSANISDEEFFDKVVRG